MNTLQQPLTHTPSDPVADSLLLTLGGALALVLLLAIVVVKVAPFLGVGTPKAKSNRLLAVKASIPVGQKERVVVVEAGEHCLVLGVTAHHINLLSQFEKTVIDDTFSAPASPKAFSSLIKAALQRHRSGDVS